MAGEIFSGEESPDVIIFAELLLPGAEQLFEIPIAPSNLFTRNAQRL